MKKIEARDWNTFYLFSEALILIEKYKKSMNLKFLKEAYHILKKLIKSDDRFLPAYINLALIAETMNKKKESFKYLKRVLSEKPDSIEAHYNMGIFYFHKYDIKSYIRALKYFRETLNLIKKTKTMNSKQKKRLKQLELLTHAGLSNVYAHYIKEMQKKAQGEEIPYHFQKVEKECRIGLRRLKKTKNILELQNWKEIRGLFRNALGIAFLYKYKKSDIAKATENITIAIKHFRYALKDFYNFRTLSNLGTAFLRLSEYKETNANLELAEKYFHEVLQLQSNYDFAYYRLAAISRKMGNLKAAKKFIIKAQKCRDRVSLVQLNKEKNLISKKLGKFSV